jgi:hypothetical protein
MNKRAQVTIFIIIAVLIIASAALVFVFKDKIGIGIFSSNSDPVYLFVQNCVQETGEDAVQFITQNGGYLFPPTLSTPDGIPYYLHNKKDYMPTKERIGEEISDYIKNSISYCTDGFTNFPDLNITEGEIKANAKIEDEKIILDVTYPLIVKKGESTKKLENFNNINIKARIGIVYNSIQNIIQEQVGKESICLSCISEIVDREGLTLDMTNTEEAIIFTITDKYSKIKDVPIEWTFANGY